MPEPPNNHQATAQRLSFWALAPRTRAEAKRRISLRPTVGRKQIPRRTAPRN